MSEMTRRIRIERSRKGCTCGGHSASDVKKNPAHHSTAERLRHRLGRLAKRKAVA